MPPIVNVYVLIAVPREKEIATADIKGVYLDRKRAEDAQRRWSSERYHVSLTESPLYEGS